MLQPSSLGLCAFPLPFGFQGGPAGLVHLSTGVDAVTKLPYSANDMFEAM